MIIVLFIAALLLVACGSTDPNDRMDQDETPEPIITDPEPVVVGGDDTVVMDDDDTTVVDDANEAAEIRDDAAEVFSGDSRRDVIGGVADVRCEVDERKLTFVLVNTGEKIWDLDQTIGFGGDPDKINLQVFVNNEEVNSGMPRYDSGERLFGPNEDFSDNCGGTTELAPGQEVECTLYPVLLKDKEQYSNTNRIWLDLAGGDVEYVSFTCD